MLIYATISFACICIGMALSVRLFGTGSKRAKAFKEIYFSIEDIEGKGILYTKTGEYSAILKIDNPVQKFSADIDTYYDFTNTMTALMQSLGEGYAIHKQDVFTRKKFGDDVQSRPDLLDQSYFRYFRGRAYTDCATYITITQENKKSRFFSYDPKKWRDFLIKVQKAYDMLRDRGMNVRFLTKEEGQEYVDRFFAMNFGQKHVSMSNFKVDDEGIGMGKRQFKIYSLVDVDNITLPTVVRPYTDIEVNNTSMPVDLLSLVSSIPDADTVVYNQMIWLPSQKQELSKLGKKKNRHSSMPSPGNLIAVEDIKKVEDVVARENKQLVYAHFNLMVVTNGTDIQKCTNYLENTFSRIGIHMSKRAYNQLELFVNSFPGNCYGMNPDYDRFLTLSSAASCLMYKENIQHSEDTPLKIWYTDRQGVPVAIDISGKEGKTKYTDNSNFFVLGPSGSGKSFSMNTIVRQMEAQDTDIILVDTGNSYEGVSEYYNGKYISYTEENPITMNPFKIRREEYNVEKIDFLKNLIMLIWKGSNGKVEKREDRLIEQVITEYYDAYFKGFSKFTPNQVAALRRTLVNNESLRSGMPVDDTDEAFNEKINHQIAELEQRRMKLKVTDLSFNTFYEYSTRRIPDICREEGITGIDTSTYSYMLKNFYKGGTYERTLNDAMDSSLFDEKLIVFEIDAIKDNPTLFPIVTLIICDCFLQKMRLKKNRKMLVIEEAWKAIASPMMAEYIKYLYKTARKFWASVGVVTQEIQDIIGSPIVKEAIINNSDVIMLLDQSKFKERFDEIKAILGLTDVECKKIFTINRLDNKEGRAFFREVFIRRGTVSDVYGVEEPHECYMTYTTERAEKEALKLYKRELHCDHKHAIMAYCRDWERSGITKSLAFAQKVNQTGHVLNLK